MFSKKVYMTCFNECELKLSRVIYKEFQQTLILYISRTNKHIKKSNTKLYRAEHGMNLNNAIRTIHLVFLKRFQIF